MKIYGDVVSPFVRMCLVTAHEAGLNDKVTLVDTHVKPAEVNAQLQKLSPVAKIPVLETDHHHALHDSRVIMEYLAHVGGDRILIPDDGVKRFRVLTLLATAQGLGDAAVGLRYEQAQRPEGTRWPDYMERLKSRILAACDEVEAHWGDALAQTTVGSIALACVLSYLDHRHDALAWRNGRPTLATFHKAFSSRPSMMAWPLAKT